MSKTLAKAKYDLARKYHLEKWQMELLEFAILPKALRPHYTYFLGKFNITKDVYYYWLRHKRFNDARRELVRQFYKDDIPDVLMAMKDEALAGNERAARLFLEYIDEWNKDPRSQEDEERTYNINEAKQVIINLHQKFYGNQKEEVETIDGEVEEVPGTNS